MTSVQPDQASTPSVSPPGPPVRTSLVYPTLNAVTLTGVPFHRALEHISSFSTLKSSRAMKLEQMVDHDHEMLVWQFANQHNMVMTRPEWAYLTEHLVARALRDAEAEDVCWTPLLDVLARQSKAWPDLPTAYKAPNGYSRTVETPLGTPVALLARVPGPSAMLARLGEWTSTATSPEAQAQLVTVLQSFAAPGIWTTVASRVPRASRVLRKMLMTNTSISLSLVRNEALMADPETRNAVAAWAPQAYEAEHGHAIAGRTSGYTSPPDAVATPCGVALVELARGPGGLSGSVRTELEEKVTARFKTKETALPYYLHALLADPATPSHLVRAIGQNSRVAAILVDWLRHPTTTAATVAEILTEHPAKRSAIVNALKIEARVGVSPPVDPAVWEALCIASLQDQDTLSDLVQDARTSLEFLRRATAETKQVSVKIAAATRADAQRDPAVRQALRTSRSPFVLEGLLAGAAPSEWLGGFRRLAVVDPKAALEWLEEHGAPDSVTLSQTDLTPLLASPRASSIANRVERVMGILSRVEVPTARPAPAGETERSARAPRRC